MGDDYPVYGSQVKRPFRVQVLRIASVVLALAGLVLLYLYSISRDIPVVQVADISPTMNFATVRIIGEVTRDAYVFKSGGIVFNVHDGTGEIAVMGGRAQAEVLENGGRLPRCGDRVDVAGSLSVSAGKEIKLRLQSAEHLELRRKSAAVHPVFSAVKLADVTADKNGGMVSVAGTLKEITVPAPGSRSPYILTLEQDGSQLEVVFWDRVFRGLNQKLPLPGSRICVGGRIDEYKGRIQLKVFDAADFEVEDQK